MYDYGIIKCIEKPCGKFGLMGEKNDGVWL